MWDRFGVVTHLERHRAGRSSATQQATYENVTAQRRRWWPFAQYVIWGKSHFVVPGAPTKMVIVHSVWILIARVEVVIEISRVGVKITSESSRGVVVEHCQCEISDDSWVVITTLALPLSERPNDRGLRGRPMRDRPRNGERGKWASYGTRIG